MEDTPFLDDRQRLSAPAAPEGAELEGRYELLERLSSGGMGAVYRGRHRTLDRLVAIKIMHPALREDPSLRAGFFEEARVASSLSHPNVVDVIDFGFDPDHGYFLVMELLAGQTLRQRMNGRPVRARVACDVVEQVAWAVRFIHSRSVVHCDLKPDNVFLTSVASSRRHNHVKLIDFGLARRLSAVPGAIGGTPEYTAPERLRGHGPSVSTDIYSLGAIFYEALTGRPPLTGTVAELVRQHEQGDRPRRPSTLSAEPLSGRADDLIMRALSFDPLDRQPTIEAFLFELRTLMSMMGMRVRRAQSTQQPILPTSSVATHKTPPRPIRIHPRATLELPVVLRRIGGQRQLRGRSRNVSRGGLFVALDRTLPLGSHVEVSLPSPDDPSAPWLTLCCAVRWRRGAVKDDPAPGYGLEWLDPPESHRAQIEELLERLGVATPA